MKTFLRWLLAGFVIFAGVSHFTTPDFFIRIVPSYLPAPEALVAISGFFEILGGVGLLIPKLRLIAAWGLMALFVAVLPANIHMAIHQIPLGETVFPTWVYWFRVVMQLPLIAWAYGVRN